MRTKNVKVIACVGLLSALLSACGGGGGTGPTPPTPYNKVSFDFFTAAALDNEMIYELWVHPRPAVARLEASTGAWHSLGRFNIRASDGKMLTPQGAVIPNNTLSGLPIDFIDYDSMMVTVESSADNDTVPSASVYLQGNIHVDSLQHWFLNFPVGFDFISGTTSLFTFATPTDADSINELSGVWFFNAERTQPGLRGLDVLPTGWLYEAWVIIRRNSQRYRLSTGRFAQADLKDLSDPYSGPADTVNFPGEDFLRNPPAGGPAFPIVFEAGDSLEITVEPDPDPVPS
ncbi:MAG: hypothetical protein HY304_07380, partial [candidate division Zixibacteria bacterium]|nr:hypothetical protein [candidate division Zixibacteria bacterium]